VKAEAGTKTKADAEEARVADERPSHASFLDRLLSFLPSYLEASDVIAPYLAVAFARTNSKECSMVFPLVQ
jgi:hypothetical protein